MYQFLRMAVLGVAILLLWCSSVYADPDTQNEGAYRLASLDRTGAPLQEFVYSNEDGFWAIGPMGSACQATYLWRGDPTSRSTVLLSFLGRGTLVERGRNTPYSGWAYQATDGVGNTQYWFFPEAPLPGPTPGGLYPLFYSEDSSPPHEALFHRYLTPEGTRRY